MAKPTSRQELVEYALRRLGAPVLEINVADEQLDDILDDTIQYFQERHYDGVIRTYLKYAFTEDDIRRGAKYNPFVNPGISTASQVYPGNTQATTNTYIENSNYIQIPDHIIGVEKVMTPPEATGSSSFPGGFYPGLGAGGAVPYGTGYLGGMGLWGGGGRPRRWKKGGRPRHEHELGTRAWQGAAGGRAREATLRSRRGW